LTGQLTKLRPVFERVSSRHFVRQATDQCRTQLPYTSGTI